VDTINIGGVKLKGRVVLAPMSGITDAPFRRLAHRFGASMVVSEMVAGHDLANGRPDTLRRTLGGGDISPFVVQLAGREPQLMAHAARIAEDLGADIIDINMGCPAKKVTGGLSGSALMREPDRALAIAAAVRGAVCVPVTVKMRTGWNEQNRNAPALARDLEAEGIAMITVHGRTRAQFYKGKSDWSFIARVKAAVSVPVIANGDVETFDDATGILGASGADGLMIGRGSQGRPWFPGAVARFVDSGQRDTGPRGARLAALMAEHYENILSHYGIALGLRAARKHLGWYVERAGLTPSVARTWRAKFCQNDDANAVRAAIVRFGDVAHNAAEAA